jgi:hypothetical protein
MPQAAPSTTASALPFASLPFRIDHKSSRIFALFGLALLVAMLGIVIVPVGLVLTFAAHDVLVAIARKPLPAAMLALGLVLWVALLLMPAKRMVQRSWRHSSVSITAERVVVAETGLLGARLWTAPLAEFRGIAHHVRASLTGVRHELILVHPDRNRSALLHAADRISQPTIDRATALFRLPQVPAGELYRFTRRRADATLVEPLPEAQAA